jgi:hypothetical protein
MHAMAPRRRSPPLQMTFGGYTVVPDPFALTLQLALGTDRLLALFGTDNLPSRRPRRWSGSRPAPPD